MAHEENSFSGHIAQHLLIPFVSLISGPIDLSDSPAPRVGPRVSTVFCLTNLRCLVYFHFYFVGMVHEVARDSFLAIIQITVLTYFCARLCDMFDD